MNASQAECFISVDIEAAGPIPGIYSMLSIGACLIDDPSVTFTCLLKPISDKADPQALGISGFTLESLQRDGQPPKIAMRDFANWIGEASGHRSPIFVGLNAGFDWSFINYYFYNYYGSNPFGFAPLDIKALYMGVMGCTWNKSKTSHMSEVLRPQSKGNHDALQDAVAQAELFRLTLKYRETMK